MADFKTFIEYASEQRILALLIKERVKITDIEVAYLPQKDQETLKQGIKIYSQQQLNKLIEDFE